ncbi:MAG: hydantoin racemase [Spirochaetota bacterium]|nr:MAG: hydantoin racemase [Spirochaetota bacterium]
MKNRILYINPIGSPDFDKEIYNFLENGKRQDTEVTITSLTKGPPHIEYHYYESLVLVDTLHKVRLAEKEGYQGAIIGCFYDPGLREAKEISCNLMVTALCEASLHIAVTLGNMFSIIVGRNKWIPRMHENVKNHGFESKLASFKSLDMGVLDFHKDEDLTIRKMKTLSREAVEKDLAEVLILGCGIQFGFYRELQKEIGVPVIDPVLASLKYIELLVEIKHRLDWGISKAWGFESPSLEEIQRFKLEEQYKIKGLWS